ncbi:heparan-alpha-glucosaminide N-acetyltransferase domain-containing protein [Chryseobacterium phocaeense]|uniref:heparan-alpha-glucosaminide N-acetyltransferase domain-containing protein n=1 Tax=Chryseobacterium phocaeense TaxID=1816690 RepID=UPI0009BAB401|nr:heparan-alpha-glucosaminide N-acetyltransferase domain-containing protein [Chryseobacterium phocaeense]
MEHQSKRIAALDLIKGMSVVGMIIIHTLLIYANVKSQSESVIGSFIVFLGRGTSIFLICMGITFMTSSHQSLKSSIKRGGLLLLAAFFMNFMKFIVPAVLGFAPDNFIQKYGWHGPIEQQYMYLVMLGDILQLAGISLLFVGFIREYVKNKYGILAIGLLIALVSRELSGTIIDYPVVNYISDLFFSNDYPAYIYFPVFPWMAFIIIGMFFGKWFLELNYNSQELFRKMLYFGLVFIAVGAPLVFLFDAYNYNGFYHMGPGGVIYFAGWTLIFLWAISRLTSNMKENKFTGILKYCSKNLTSMYMIQWILISWGKGIFGYRQHGIGFVLMLIVLYIILTFSVQKLLDLLKKKKPGIVLEQPVSVDDTVLK